MSDVKQIFGAAASENSLSSNCSYVNIFLLRNKFDLEIAYYKDFVFRRYNQPGGCITEGRASYGFPSGSGDLKEALAVLRLDAAESGRNFNFSLVAEQQLPYLVPQAAAFGSSAAADFDSQTAAAGGAAINPTVAFGSSAAADFDSQTAAAGGAAINPTVAFGSSAAADFGGQDAAADSAAFSGCTDISFSVSTNRDAADYIYTQAALAHLPGRKYARKRNHISRFLRLYPDCRYQDISRDTLDDVLAVARQWLQEHEKESSDYLQEEYQYIIEALQYFAELQLMGGVLYVNEKAVAMTVASPISAAACDVHFEKALSAYADQGAYAVLNRSFARSVPQFAYINREEDLGILKLRQAKLAYYPELLYTKYSLVSNNN